MTKKQNPYHLWLGLPENLTAPNYFQLLGVDAKDQDQQRIAQTARSNAQALLDRLTKVAPKTDSEKAIRDKLKVRIVTAHKTLVDPEKRNQYITALSQKQGSASQISSIGAIEPSAPVQSPPQPPAQSPAQPPQQPIQQAIPMAMPVNQTAPPSVPTSAASNSSDPFAGIEADESLRVRPVRARGKRSSMIPIVVTLLVIAVIGGLVSFLTSYKNVFEVLANREHSSSAAAASNGAVSASSPDNEAAEEPVKPLAVPDNFAELQREQEKAAMANKSAAEENAPPKDAPPKDAPPKDTPPKEMPSKEMPSKEIDVTPTEVAPVEIVSKTFPPAYAGFNSDYKRGPWGSVLRASANRVHVALRNRDVESARRASQQRQQLIEAADVPAAVKAAHQKLADIDNEMIVHIENFLKQVRSAAIEMPGGQDIKVGSLIMALVDANQNEITVRRAGRNEMLPYEILPTSVAIAIGEQGSKESVPKWRLAQAADYAVRLDARARGTVGKVEVLLKQLQSDGYDSECNSLKNVMMDTINGDSATENPLSDLSQDELTEVMAEFRGANGYKNPAFIKPDGGQTILDKLLFEPSEDPQERVARLTEAVAVAARLIDFDSLLVATEELYVLADMHNVKDTLVLPINRLMRTDISAVQARQLVKTILRIIENYDGPSFDKAVSSKLFNHAQTLVDEFQFPEMDAMLKSLKARSAGA